MMTALLPFVPPSKAGEASGESHPFDVDAFIGERHRRSPIKSSLAPWGHPHPSPAQDHRPASVTVWACACPCTPPQTR
ncbi:type II toxin-antitoxin system ParD family antitoxin [Rhizobium straminoryzae]|uniref:type II toxin-antitoxin system ParD family antitoxin n=1 Tax=Rhizobium straminoryzae TaxID=1387186 RepID=UPI003CCC59E1